MSPRTALRSPSHAGRRRRVTPRLEFLEGRLVPAYLLTDLGTLGGAGSAAHAINAVGQVVGDADSAPWTGSLSGRHAFLGGRGPLQDLGTLDQQHSAARAINKGGQVVGWTYDQDNDRTPHAFIWEAGTGMRDLGIFGRAYGINADGHVAGEYDGGGAFFLREDELHFVPTLPGYATNAAYAVNNHDDVVGAVRGGWDDAAGSYLSARAFLWNRTGEVEDLGTLPGAEHSEALAINDAGQVVGRTGVIACGRDFCGWAASRGFLWQRDVGMIDLGSIGLHPSINVVAHGLNARGDVVGTADGRAFLHTGGNDGAMTDLAGRVMNLGRWALTAATGINEAGQIVGYGEIDGQTHAFLLKPRPFFIEPPVFCLLPLVTPVPLPPVVVGPLPACPERVDPAPVRPCPVPLPPVDGVITLHIICGPRPVPVAAAPEPVTPVCLVSFGTADLAGNVWQLWCARRVDSASA